MTTQPLVARVAAVLGHVWRAVRAHRSRCARRSRGRLPPSIRPVHNRAGSAAAGILDVAGGGLGGQHLGSERGRRRPTARCRSHRRGRRARCRSRRRTMGLAVGSRGPRDASRGLGGVAPSGRSRGRPRSASSLYAGGSQDCWDIEQLLAGDRRATSLAARSHSRIAPLPAEARRALAVLGRALAAPCTNRALLHPRQFGLGRDEPERHPVRPGDDLSKMACASLVPAVFEYQLATP